MNRRPIVVAISGVILLAACGKATDQQPLLTKRGVANPTYSEHVSSILNANCVICHREGGIAPFALDNYKDAAENANGIAARTASRDMPPWLVDNSGSCNTYEHARWMSDDDIATLGNWAAQNAPVGNPSSEPLNPPSSSSLTAKEISITAGLPEDYKPQGSAEHGQDEYRCFILGAEFAADKFVTAFQFKPGNARLVHHMLLFKMNAEQLVDAQKLDEQSAGLGYRCFGDSGSPNAPVLAGWAPGTGATYYPQGTGIKITSGDKLVMQIHYNLANATSNDTDRSAIDLKLEGSVDKVAAFVPISKNEPFEIPANSVKEVSTFFGPLPSRVTIYGVYPHMHTRGKSLHVEAIEDGQSSCLVDVPKWKFRWQQFFFYSKPVTVEKGGAIKLSCTYSTLGSQSPVRSGDGTQEEMCVNFFYLTGLQIPGL